MDTITIKIEGRENVSFFISLLQKFNFIKEVTVNKKKAVQNKNIDEAPIEWAEKHPPSTHEKFYCLYDRYAGFHDKLERLQAYCDTLQLLTNNEFR